MVETEAHDIEEDLRKDLPKEKYETGTSSLSLHHRNVGMESSVLRFRDLNFVAGTKTEPKQILSDVSGSVKWGRK